MSVREHFVQTFDEELAQRIEAAALKHADDDLHANRGSDPFKWALCICIGWQCISLPGYAIGHDVDPEALPAIKQWVIDHGDLANHDGDLDYLALFVGAYQEWLPEEAKA